MARPRAPWRHFRSRSWTASSWWRSRSPRALASFRRDAARGAHYLTGEILTSKLNEPDQKFRPRVERGRKPHDRYQDILAKRRCGSAARGRHVRGLGADAADHRAAEQRDEVAARHVDFVLALITSAVSARQPASLIFTRATSDILPSGTMRSACADASPACTS